MSDIGVFKEFDKLGRIVIPKDLRERYSLFGKVEIIATSKDLLIRNPEYILVLKNEEQNNKNDT
ncbi:MAG: hypothetical protein IJ515_01095 [Clostridia bacterium]|nr:hypothetical protein [Clostridia bacterium]